jgi:hypothetical protein
MKIYFLILVIFGLIASSCATSERCSTKYPCVIKDSVTVKIEYKDRPVIVHDTTYIESFYPNPCAALCDSLGRVKKGFSVTVPNTKGTTTTLKEKNGGIVAETPLNGMSVIASVPSTTVTSKETVRAECPLEHLTWCDKLWIKVGKGTACIIGLGILIFAGRILLMKYRPR